MITGRDGVEQMLLRQKVEKEALQNHILNLKRRYEDLQEAIGCYRKKRESFYQLMTQKREKAQKIAQCSHPPYIIKEFSDYLREELYGSDYEDAVENIKAFEEEILKEQEILAAQIEEEEKKRQMTEQKILALEKLMV